MQTQAKSYMVKKFVTIHICENRQFVNLWCVSDVKEILQISGVLFHYLFHYFSTVLKT